MIWLKRIAPFVIIFLAYVAYDKYTTHQLTERHETERVHALIAARLWVAGAEFRDEPEAFLVYRDSFLTAHNFTLNQMNDFLKRYEKHPEDYRAYTQWVSFYVDSLYVVEDSVAADSMESVGK